jgi:hypothetical protein
MVAVWAEPVALWNDHEGGAETGGVVAGITAVAQQDPFGMVAVTLKSINQPIRIILKI